MAQARGDVSGTVKHARRALDLLPEDDHLGAEPQPRSWGLHTGTSGDLEAAHRTLADAMADFQMAGNMHFAISGTYGLADIRIEQGRLREAVRTYEQVIAACDGAGRACCYGERQTCIWG